MHVPASPAFYAVNAAPPARGLYRGNEVPTMFLTGFVIGMLLGSVIGGVGLALFAINKDRR